MRHLINLLLFFSFSISLVAISISETYRRNSKLPVFIKLRNYYISIALLLLTNFLFGYQGVALAKSPAGTPFPLSPRYMLLLIFSCIPFYTYYLSGFQLMLVRKPMTKSFSRLYWIIAGSLLLFYISNFYFDYVHIAIPFDFFYEILINQLSLLLLTIVSLYVWNQAKKGGAKHSTRPVIISNIVFFLMFAAIFIIMIFYYFAWIHRGLYLLGLAIAWSVINATPLFHFRSIVLILKEFPVNKDPETVFHILADDCGITRREYEIIALALSGKTNKEISDNLFIGLQTVKDHVSRIFKKLKVDNRVQMINRVRDLTE